MRIAAGGITHCSTGSTGIVVHGTPTRARAPLDRAILQRCNGCGGAAARGTSGPALALRAPVTAPCCGGRAGKGALRSRKIGDSIQKKKKMSFFRIQKRVNKKRTS
jgi:hypothetical protein